MKIKKLEFENFRQFKGKNTIIFSDDSNLTVIYGKNGNGKTTVHQLFQWILYGKMAFNKTATNKLYNLEYDKTAAYMKEFSTWGKITFEHNGNEYFILRETYFQKENLKIREKGTEVKLCHLDAYGGIDSVIEDPEKVSRTIEEILPSALKDYFFFDGENMIADLARTGDDSAESLRKALFRMFDLSYLESAKKHIGDKNNGSTVIGKLYKTKKVNIDDKEAVKIKYKIDEYQNYIDVLSESVNNLNTEINDLRKKNIELSEKIGSIEDTHELEKERSSSLKNIELMESEIESKKLKFGEIIFTQFPRILLKDKFDFAYSLIKKQTDMSNKTIPYGLTKELVEFLLGDENEECICGSHLTPEAKDKLKDFLKCFPPYSNYAILENMKSMMRNVDTDEVETDLEDCFKKIFSYNDQIEESNGKIEKIDREMKEAKKYEDIIGERKSVEIQIKEKEEELSNESFKLNAVKKLLERDINDYDKYTEQDIDNRIIDKKIKLIEEVGKKIQDEIALNSKRYSKELEENMDFLLKKMLTSSRKVTISDDFTVKIFDSYNDESKSEGQFAVVSFAYIGGIFKLLQEEEALENKEYPLVLDGPFSKLDENQKSNVMNVIPKFAPQIILFSKDQLKNYVDANNNIWVIFTNNEKNYSEFKQVSLAEADDYFKVGGDIL